MQGNQRWRERRETYRRPDEQARRSDYDVVELPDDRLTRPFVEKHHYSGTYPAARRRFGLFDCRGLAGVAVFSVPAGAAVLGKAFPCHHQDALELGRLVLLDAVPGNGESLFVGQCLRLLARQGFYGVLSFSDPVPRRLADGTEVFPGHVGTVYQALNARYTGRGRARTLRVLPDGTIFSDRCVSKIRALDQGWQYAVRRLEAFGADASEQWRAWRQQWPGFDYRSLWRDWLAEWLPRKTSPLRHGGCHRYAWTLTRKATHLLPALPYPKKAA
jgi:hypothetical protein